ncbi:hypothetical protein HLH34_01940 [Gluconacetobacter azotocaptans]|uniref:Uncharacterized protein n=1 Tax=Gluconacetobacter azotocaptans TaxID=142834 RepID=A0A7W4JPW3_9PROT|nr:hypothetical protein [Gluconacetobacter azotocaptans]
MRLPLALFAVVHVFELIRDMFEIQLVPPLAPDAPRQLRRSARMSGRNEVDTNGYFEIKFLFIFPRSYEHTG